MHWTSIWDAGHNSRRWLSISPCWIEESFLYTKICFVAMLYLLSYNSKSAMYQHWSSMIQTCCCSQLWQLQIKIVSNNFYRQLYVPTSFRNTSSLVLFSSAVALFGAFWQPSTPLTLWAGPLIYNKRRVYMDFRVQCTWQCVIAFSAKFQYGWSGYIYAWEASNLEEQQFKGCSW